MIALVTALFGLAVWVAWPRPALIRLQPMSKSGLRRLRPEWLIGVAGIIFAVVAVRSSVLSLLAAGLWLSGVVAVVIREHYRRRRRFKVREQVAQACTYFAGLQTIGMIPAQALAFAARRLPILRSVAVTSEMGGSVPDALLAASSQDGGVGFRNLGRAWSLAENTGASLMFTLTAVVTDLDEQQRVQDLVATELAAPRATGRVLAALPFVGLLFGFGFGGNPIDFLLGSLAGRCCFLGGVTLAGLGLLWSELLAAKASGS